MVDKRTVEFQALDGKDVISRFEAVPEAGLVCVYNIISAGEIM